MGLGEKNERGMNERPTSALYMKKEQPNAHPPRGSEKEMNLNLFLFHTNIHFAFANIRVNAGGWRAR